MMPLTPRVRSASKADFMSGLGLTSGDQLHENLYVAMKVLLRMVDTLVTLRANQDPARSHQRLQLAHERET